MSESEFYDYLQRHGYIGEEAQYEYFKTYLRYFDPSESVLDVGCGRGEFLELLRDRGCIGSGVDLDAGMIEICRSKGLNVSHDDAFALLVKQEAAYDGVFAANFVEHLEPAQVSDFLKKAYRALKHNGRLVVAVPNPESIAVHLYEFWRDATHVRMYNRALLEFMFAHEGFEIIASGENTAAGGGYSPVANFKMEELDRLEEVPLREETEGLDRLEELPLREEMEGLDRLESPPLWEEMEGLERLEKLPVDEKCDKPEGGATEGAFHKIRNALATFVVRYILSEQFEYIYKTFEYIYKTIESTGRNVEAANRNVDRMNRNLYRLRAGLEASGRNVEVANRNVDRMNRNLYRLRAGLEASGRNVDVANRNVDRMNRNLYRLRAGLEAASRNVDVGNRNVDRMNRNLTRTVGYSAELDANLRRMYPPREIYVVGRKR